MTASIERNARVVVGGQVLVFGDHQRRTPRRKVDAAGTVDVYAIVTNAAASVRTRTISLRLSDFTRCTAQ